jgi:hypothetical protein
LTSPLVAFFIGHGTVFDRRALFSRHRHANARFKHRPGRTLDSDLQVAVVPVIRGHHHHVRIEGHFSDFRFLLE